MNRIRAIIFATGCVLIDPEQSAFRNQWCPGQVEDRPLEGSGELGRRRQRVRVVRAGPRVAQVNK